MRIKPVQQRLHKPTLLARINFLAYIEKMLKHLYKADCMNPELVNLHLRIKPFFLSVDSAIACGLILTELVSNCFRHAFPRSLKGEVLVKVESLHGENIMIEVTDNGVGFPADFSLESTQASGLQRVRQMIRKLGGQMRMQSEQGVSF